MSMNGHFPAGSDCPSCGCDKNDHWYRVEGARVGYFCRTTLHKNGKEGPCMLDHNGKPDSV